MIFLEKYYFLLIIIPLIFRVFFLAFKKRGYKSEITNDLIKIFKRNTYISYINIFGIIAILSTFSILLANPNTTNTIKLEKKNGIDIEILFDISYSMKAEDLKPNRMEIAKEVLNSFISKITSDRVGLIIFAGKPFSGVPTTFDYSFLNDYIKNINVDTINQNYTYLQGTAMGDALLMGIKALDDGKKDRQKVIILMTDGEANKGIAPLQAVKLAKEKNIKVYTVGIGGTENTYVYLVDQIGRQTKVEIGGVDEKTLKAIADITNASYFRATDSDSLKKIFEELGKLNKTDIEIEKQVLYKPAYYIFEYILIFLIFTIALSNFFYFSRD